MVGRSRAARSSGQDYSRPTQLTFINGSRRQATTRLTPPISSVSTRKCAVDGGPGKAPSTGLQARDGIAEDSSFRIAVRASCPVCRLGGSSVSPGCPSAASTTVVTRAYQRRRALVVVLSARRRELPHPYDARAATSDGGDRHGSQDGSYRAAAGLAGGHRGSPRRRLDGADFKASGRLTKELPVSSGAYPSLDVRVVYSST